MPKIFIKGAIAPEIVSDEKANEAIEKKNQKSKDLIEINGRFIPPSQIKEVVFSDEIKKKEINLDNQVDKDEILKFEKELKEFREKTKLERPIEFYGDIDKKREGFVFDSTLGFAHWSVFEYCLRNRVFSRPSDWKNYGYSICSTFDGATPNYNEFIRKWKGLRELNARRNFAEKKSFESLKDVKTNLERQKEAMKMSEQEIDFEEKGLTIDDLPF